MGISQVDYFWRRPGAVSGYSTAVSLHSHTLYSRELLDFIPRFSRSVPGLSGAIQQVGRKHDVLWQNAWWTPPLGPREAWLTEVNQIKDVLDLASLVSITDHDDIAAPLHLRVLPEAYGVPVSVEWTVPWDGTFLHIGVHNIIDAEKIWPSMCGAAEGDVPTLLEGLSSHQETLVVFNHPFWDEKGIGGGNHGRALVSFLGRCGQWIHAIELNGLRPWAENRRAQQLATVCGKPVISGGDRHGREPNGCLNLTNASSFAEFVAKVRDGRSHVLFMPQYRENRTLRFAHQVWDVLRRDESHGLGWHAWDERIFYRCQDGQVRSMRELWGGRAPLIVRAFLAGVELMAASPLRSALRAALPSSEELA